MKTYNIKLQFKCQEEIDRLMKTFKIHQSIWNYLSEYLFVRKSTFKLSSRILQEKTYHKCRKLFPEAPSQIVIKATQDVTSAFKTIKSNKEIDDLEKPPIKKNLSIRLDKRLYTIKGNSIKITTNGKKAICTFNPYPKLQEFLNKYPMCDPLIFERNKEVWLAITFDDTVIPLPDNYCIGTDLGTKRTAATSEGVMIVDKVYLRQRRKVRYLRRQLKIAKKADIHQGGKGNSARKHLKKIRRYERNLSKNYTHLTVNKILETQANTIVIEDLSGMKKVKKGEKDKNGKEKDIKNKGKKFNNRQSQVPYYMLRTILEYKAQALGKRVETVNPYNTSKDDYRDKEKGIRKGCRYYASDGKVFDADLQASISIAKRWSRKNKLPISFVEPIDGRYKLNGQASVNKPYVLCL